MGASEHNQHKRPAPPRAVAVIDVGTTSIRMAIAEITADGDVRHIDSVARAVSLGRDTFTRGSIRRGTIEECVRVLKSYRNVLQEYGIASKDTRVVATSAVREASNRLAFLDRIYIATGLDIDALEEAEVNRVTYMSIYPHLASLPELRSSHSVVIEVGGGQHRVAFGSRSQRGVFKHLSTRVLAAATHH